MAGQNLLAADSAAELKDRLPEGKSVRPGWSEAWIWAVLIVGVLIDFLYIRAFAVDVIWMDEWSFIPYLQQFNEGRLDFGQFLQYQHNEHKLFVPLMMLFMLARLTAYNGVAVQYLGLVIMAVTAVAVVFLARRRLITSPFGVPFLALIAGFMLYLRQWENLISGFSAATLAVSMFFVLTVYLLDGVRKLDWRIWTASITGFCATYSFGNGLLTWPIGTLMLIGFRKFEPPERRKSMTLPLIVWTVLGGLVWLFYFSRYASNPNKDLSHRVPVLFQSDHLLGTVQAFFAALANPLAVTFELNGAIAIGVALFVILCFVTVALVRKQWRISRECIAPLSMLLFSLLTTGLIFLGRAPDGAEQLLVPRYSSVTCLGIVGLFIFALSAIAKDSAQKTAIAACLACAMFTAIIGTALSSIEAGRNIKAIRTEVAQILKNYKNESDERLIKIMPYPQVLRTYTPIAEHYGYSVFRNR